jgi:hypothetical protein
MRDKLFAPRRSTSTPLRALDSLLEALNRLDRKGLAACMAADTSLLRSDGVTVYDHKAILAELIRLFAASAPLELEALSMRGMGKVVAFDQRWCSQRQVSDPDPSPGVAHATAVFRCEEGKWLLTLFSLDTDPARL